MSMPDSAPVWATDPRLARARAHASRNEVLQAELLLRALLQEYPDCVPAALAVARFCTDRGDLDAAAALLISARHRAPTDTALTFALAQVHWRNDDPVEATALVEALLTRTPEHHTAWLMLADLREQVGNTLGALRARYQGLTRAQAAGRWTGRATTEPALVEAVLRHAERLRRDRREYLHGAISPVLEAHGSRAVARVERALAGYLGEVDATPSDPRQRPKFFYFPDLPAGPYHDPLLQPWAATLRDAWTAIRDEAAALLLEDKDFISFLGLKPGQKAPEYVGGDAENPAWDAFFFYRRGKRHDDNHARCPRTSALLESIDLCRVGQQAPEVCFSVIRPRSTIMAHHGVTNTRLVFHLPLIVPQACALNVVDAGQHHWREGEPMMFDDTYAHEAWNHSDQPRLILLMDCWNPHLTLPERQAVKALVEAIDALEN